MIGQGVLLMRHQGCRQLQHQRQHALLRRSSLPYPHPRAHAPAPPVRQGRFYTAGISGARVRVPPGSNLHSLATKLAATSCCGYVSYSFVMWRQQQQQQQQFGTKSNVCTEEQPAATILALSSRDDSDTNNDQDHNELLFEQAHADAGTVELLGQWLVEMLEFWWDSFLVTIRATEIVLRLSPLLILTPASMATAYLFHGEGSANNRNNAVANFTWWYVTRTFQSLGPSYVKLCQWVATRRDIFPPNICDRLGVLHDRGLPHAWLHTHEVLCEAFGDDYAEKGLDIRPQDVIGTGSAAQVYKGTLTQLDPNGKPVVRKVAIKVLHPHFKRNVEKDLWLMETVASMLHSLPVERIQMMNIPRATDNFASILRRQADLRIEGENLRKFRANFYHTQEQEDLSQIIFPRAISGWTMEKVMVEDLVTNATSIAAFLHDSTPQGLQVRKELGGLLCRAFFKMVFLDNFVHCDLHPGNIRVMELDEQTSKKIHSRTWHWPWTKKDEKQLLPGHKLIFLDAGIAFSLRPNDKKNLRDLFRAVVTNDGNRAGRLMVERARYERCSQMPGGVDAFAAGIESIVSEFHDRRKGGLTFGKVRIGSLLNRVLDLCREYGVEIDPSMSSIVISVLVLEGLARSLEPSMNLFDVAIPFVLGAGRV